MSIEKLSKDNVTTRQLKAARALLGWSQGQLAANSGVSEPTIARLEAEDGVLGGRRDTVAKILKALQNAGVQFLAEDNGGLGVRLMPRSSP